MSMLSPIKQLSPTSRDSFVEEKPIDKKRKREESFAPTTDCSRKKSKCIKDDKRGYSSKTILEKRGFSKRLTIDIPNKVEKSKSSSVANS